MVTFRFITVGENLGTRKLGEKTRNELLPLLRGDERVILDFEGVNIVSNSFADECLAKLLLFMPLEDLKKKTTFRGLNDFVLQRLAVSQVSQCYDQDVGHDVETAGNPER